MILAEKIKLNPTKEQEDYFLRACGVARFVWNYGLYKYKETKEKGEKVDWNEIEKYFNEIKKEQFPFVLEVTKSAAQVAFMDLRQSISTYYKSKKKSKDVRFPKFRSRKKSIGSFGLQNDQFTTNGNLIKVPKLGYVNMSSQLQNVGRILSGRIKEENGNWSLIVTLEVENKPQEEFLYKSVGIDFGLSTMATLSNGEVYETQAYFRKSERKLKMLQRSLSRKKKGSANRNKARKRVAKLHKHTVNQRKDFTHKTTTDIAKTFEIVCVENLNLKGMIKWNLAKSVNDAAIGMATFQLKYKKEKFGGTLQKVGRFFPSSKMCHVCKTVNKELKLSDREWTCLNCGTLHNRDFNASKNIEIEGLNLLAGTSWVSETPVEFGAAG